MPTIECCVNTVEPVSPDADGAHLLARFKAEPSTLAIPVVEQGRPLGLVSRDTFLLTLAGPFGHQLCQSRPARDLMDAEPAIFEAGLKLGALPASMLEGAAEALLSTFIVTRNGRYLGLGTGLGLVQAQNRVHAETIEQLREDALRVAGDSQSHRDAAQAKSKFLQRLGQNLRTPLNGVGAVAEMLHRQPIGDSAHAHVQTIIDSAEATLRTLQDAIDLARAEAGDLPI